MLRLIAKGFCGAFAKLSKNGKLLEYFFRLLADARSQASVLGGLRKGAYAGEACGSPLRIGPPLGSHRQRVLHYVHGNLRAMVLDFVLSALIDVVDPERILRRIDLGQQPCF